MSMTDAPTPADSATVILLREPEPDQIEVLLVARHTRSRTFAGAHVFPGGLVEATDQAADLLRAISPCSKRQDKADVQERAMLPRSREKGR